MKRNKHFNFHENSSLAGLIAHVDLALPISTDGVVLSGCWTYPLHPNPQAKKGLPTR